MAQKKPTAPRSPGEQRLGITFQKGNGTRMENIQERAAHLINAIDSHIILPKDLSAEAPPKDKRRHEAWAAKVLLHQEIRENIHRAKNAALAAVEKAVMCAQRGERELDRVPLNF